MPILKLNPMTVARRSINFGAAFTLAAFALFVFNTTPLSPGLPIADDIWSNFGQLVGGIVGTLLSFVGIVLIIENLSDQERAFRIQQLEWRKQQVESRFFELVRIQRENSNSINVQNRTGRKVFMALLREFYECYAVVQRIGSTYGWAQSAQIDVAYLAFFYGSVGPASEQVLRHRLTQRLDQRSIDALMAAFEQQQRNLIASKTFPYTPFEGHQVRLGHYFRHLYQSVTYINKQSSTLLRYDEKYEYVKTLRAQLSTQEQVLLFLNSLSELGRPWELGHAPDSPNSRLITKYNLVKNIPLGFVADIDVESFYPDVCYEGATAKSDRRKALEQRYC